MASQTATLMESWGRAWSEIGARPNDSLRDQLMASYSETGRMYHTRQHLAECVEALARSGCCGEHPGEVEVALWFHDAVYDLKGSNNEELSAAWAKFQLLQSGVSPESAARVYGLIMATGHSFIPQSPDEQLVVDVDLAILGAPRKRFDEYESQVQQEYAWVTPSLYRLKRREVLRQFLARPSIYSTPYFCETLEATARENLQRSIAALAPRT